MNAVARPRLPAENASSQELKQMLDEMDASLKLTRRRLAEAQASYGDKVLSYDADKIKQAKKDLDALQASEAAMSAGLAALERRVAQAIERENEEAFAARWDAATVALEGRTAAFVKVEETWRQFHRAVNDAVTASELAWTSNPIRSNPRTPLGLAVFERFTDLHEIQVGEVLEIAKVVAGADPLGKRPLLSERSRRDAMHVLSLRMKKPPAAAA